MKTFLLSLLLLSTSVVNAAPAQPIYVASTVPYTGPAADGATALGPDCPWDERLVKYLAKSSGNRVVVHPKPMEAQGQKLILTAKLGPTVGAGEKLAPGWIEVRGSLVDETGKSLGDFGFRDDRYSGSLHKCKEAVRLAEGLGDSIADWLEEPKPGIKIAETINTRQEDTIAPEIKKSCPWNTELPGYLSGYGNVYRVAEDINTAPGKKLILTIVDSRLLGGGLYTGSKWLTVTGSLIENGHEIGSFVAMRHSFRAWTGCGISDRLSYELAYDISNWLQSPSLNARLGDADASTNATP
ncbi:MAG TPA: hypothetical protein VJ572_00570 [Azonexus sp.]|nr:hypothetical protein [Azonexus sp.]